MGVSQLAERQRAVSASEREPFNGLSNCPLLRASPAAPGQAWGHCPYARSRASYFFLCSARPRTYGCSGRTGRQVWVGANLRVRPPGSTEGQLHRYVPWVTTEPGEGRHVVCPYGEVTSSDFRLLLEAQVAWRRARPGSAPVCFPWSMTTWPFTMTYSTPSESCLGS